MYRVRGGLGPCVMPLHSRSSRSPWPQRPPNGDPRSDADIAWTSDTPSVAAVDPAGLVTGVAPGKARVIAKTGQASASTAVTIVANPVRSLAVTPRSTRARTGDVVHFSASA